MTKSKFALMTVLFGGFLVTPTAGWAQTWSTAGSVCQPGSDSVGLYSYNVGIFQFAAGSTGEIRTRCTITNPLDSGVPSWKTMTVGYVDPDGLGTDYQVDVELERTNKSTGVTTVVKTFDSSSFSSTGRTSHSIAFTHTFDFTNYAYFVSLDVIRGDTAGNPGVWYVQLK
jgi:hypothetical protein